MENSDIYNEIECKICSENFIKLTSKEYDKYLEDNKDILPDQFENNTCCRLWEQRFECLICKNIVCRQCYWSFKNSWCKPHPNLIYSDSGDARDDYFWNGSLNEDGFFEGCQGEDCPIICPFCRTKDYKIYYGNQVPYELLNDIRKTTKNSVLRGT